MKLKMYQDKYLCFGITFNHAKFLKDLTCRFLATLFSTILLFNVLAHRYQKHRKNDLIDTKQIAHLNHRSISLTVSALISRLALLSQFNVNVYYKMSGKGTFYEIWSCKRRSAVWQWSASCDVEINVKMKVIINFCYIVQKMQQHPCLKWFRKFGLIIHKECFEN